MMILKNKQRELQTRSLLLGLVLPQETVGMVYTITELGTGMKFTNDVTKSDGFFFFFLRKRVEFEVKDANTSTATNRVEIVTRGKGKVR